MFLKFFEIKNVDFSIGMSTNMGLESDFYDIRKKKSSCCCERPINTDNSIIHSLEFTKTSYNLKISSVFLCIFWTALNPLLVFKECFLTLILVWEKNTTEGKSFTVLQSPTLMFLNF